MPELCKFYKSGVIIYKNINLINLATTSIFEDITNSEIINSDDVYINKSYNRYYHKFKYGSSYTFLEWRQSKDTDWEWFRCDIDGKSLLTLDDYLNKPFDQTINEVDTEKLKKELYDNVLIVINKYNLNSDQSSYILSKINDIEDINLK